MKKSTIIIVCLLASNFSIGQDIHLSQYYMAPLIVNPASTGIIDGKHRAIINYKDQWRSIGIPYKTYALSYDTKLFEEKLNKSYLGAGFFAFRDKAGDSEFSTTQFNLSVSGVVSLNENHKISGGLQGGYAQKSLDLANVSTDNQFYNGQHDPLLNNGETNNFNSSSFGDFSAGLLWSYVKQTKIYRGDEQLTGRAGIAFYHFNRPTQKFYSIDPDRLYSKIAVHGDAFIGYKEKNYALLPSVLFLKQGPSIEFNIGTMLRYRIREGSLYTGLVQETAVSIGCYYRAGDAIIPAVNFEIASFMITISYDINTSNLKSASKGRGGLEISLRYLNPNPFKRPKTRTLL